ncbi:MAG: hypothetical protein LQ340_000037 [Diploschistes diacapsis]|nr:MAG: hypothetical protein LQ340_000037 [Diploschistes diacapsis]
MSGEQKLFEEQVEATVLMRRSSTDIFEDYMIVTEPVFDEDRNGWVYRLKEDSSTGLSWPKKVKETNLKRRR